MLNSHFQKPLLPLRGIQPVIDVFFIGCIFNFYWLYFRFSLMNYRSDIDGLRAIAVLAVIFSHANIAHFGGGFIGVDVFFVLSGYLITSIILEDYSRRDFSLTLFYQRRVKRILPALFFVLACSAAVAWFLLLPGAYGLLKEPDAVGALCVEFSFPQENRLFCCRCSRGAAFAHVEPWS